MTTMELKTKIFREIDNVPENALPELFNYIKSIQISPEKKDIKKIIDRIIKEDAALLKRLAE